MILRTPPPQRKRRAESALDDVESPAATTAPVSDRRLVLYNDAAPVSSHDPSDQMVCTYQCRQMVKSEVMDALSHVERQLLEHKSKVESLTNELCTSETERMKFRDQLCLLEQELAASKGREKFLQERILKEVDDSQKNYQQLLQRYSELEIQLKREVQLRKDADSLAVAAKEKAASLEEKVTCLSETTEREKRHLVKELSDCQYEAKSSHSRLSIELEQMRVRANCAIEESELLKKQLEELKEQLNEVLQKKNQLEHKLLDSMAISQTSGPSEDLNLVKHLQDALQNYEIELQEARRLKSSHVNVELLKEKLLEEKICRERAEVELTKLQEVEINAIRLEDELAALRSVVKEIPDISSFEEIPTKIAALQQEAIDSLKKVGDANERLKELEVALELANLDKQRAETELVLAREKSKESELEAKQLKQLLGLVTEERDRLRKDAANNQRNVDSGGATVDELPIKKLESVLAEKEACIQELVSNLQEQREVINHQHDELKIANEKLNIETKRIKTLEREGDRLRSEISLLESKLGHGDFSATNTKVLRMVNTLAVDNEAKHTIEALRAELQKAQAKLQAVEELKGKSDAGNLIDADISEKLAQLKGQIATLEKREERYKTVFADKISVFRRACCSLFGYKIIMDDQQRPNGIPVTRFTLQSIYAQTDDEKLEFEYESGNTSILVNHYTSQPEISQQVEIFIRKMNSIPAFTANLTVESFNKRTLT